MLTERRITTDDADALSALITRANVAHGIAQVLTTDELVEQFADDSVDLANRSLAVADPDGSIVGFALVEHQAAVGDVDEQTCHLEGCVDPAWLRQGIGTRLLQWSVEAATAVLRSIDDERAKRIRFGADERVADAAAIAERAGFVPVRWFEELLRPLTDPLTVPAVDGVRIEPWPSGLDDELRVLKNTAFRDHWGRNDSTPEMWHQQLHGHAGRTDLSFIAVDESTGRPVALLVTARYPEDDDVLGRRDGWVQTLATLRPWRGRGAGSALIAAALAAYTADGLTHASIAVDSANPSGAARLYRALGFAPNQRSVAFQLELA